MFCASSLSASLGFCDATEPGTKPEISLSQTRPYLSTAQIHVKASVKGNTKTNKCKPGCMCVSSTLCNRNARVNVTSALSQTWGFLINPYLLLEVSRYLDSFISAKEKHWICFICSFIIPNYKAQRENHNFRKGKKRKFTGHSKISVFNFVN